MPRSHHRCWRTWESYPETVSVHQCFQQTWQSRRGHHLRMCRLQVEDEQERVHLCPYKQSTIVGQGDPQTFYSAMWQEDLSGFPYFSLLREMVFGIVCVVPKDIFFPKKMHINKCIKNLDIWLKFKCEVNETYVLP